MMPPDFSTPLNTLWCMMPCLFAVMMMPVSFVVPFRAGNISAVMRNMTVEVALFSLTFAAIGFTSYRKALTLDLARLGKDGAIFQSDFRGLATFTWIIAGAMIAGWLIAYKHVEIYLLKKSKEREMFEAWPKRTS